MKQVPGTISMLYFDSRWRSSCFYKTYSDVFTGKRSVTYERRANNELLISQNHRIVQNKFCSSAVFLVQKPVGNGPVREIPGETFRDGDGCQNNRSFCRTCVFTAEPSLSPNIPGVRAKPTWCRVHARSWKTFKNEIVPDQIVHRQYSIPRKRFFYSLSRRRRWLYRKSRTEEPGARLKIFVPH